MDDFDQYLHDVSVIGRAKQELKQRVIEIACDELEKWLFECVDGTEHTVVVLDHSTPSEFIERFKKDVEKRALYGIVERH